MIKNDILVYLSENKNKFIASSVLCYKFSISCGYEIRKIIRKLRKQGWAIIANAKGYCLTDNKKMLEKYIQKRLIEVEDERDTLLKMWNGGK